MIVVDSSAAVDFLLTRELGPWVEEHLRAADDIGVPHLLDVEVVGALRRLARNGEISELRAEQALADLVDLDVTRYPHLPFMDAMWSLRENLSAYDAAFVALAEALGASLVTTDLRIARAPNLPVRVVAPI